MAEVEKTWETMMDIYNHPGAFIISGTLFSLYTILSLIDVNGIIKSYNILDIDNTSRSTIIFAYIGGYYMFILKLIIYLLTLFILVTIIRIGVVVILSMFKQQLKTGGGASEIKAQYGGAISDIIQAAVLDNLKIFLGFFSVPKLSYFIFIFFVLIPLMYLFSLYTITSMYDQKRLQNESQEHITSILNTHHHNLLFIMSCFIVIGILYMLIRYYYTIVKEEAKEL